MKKIICFLTVAACGFGLYAEVQQAKQKLPIAPRKVDRETVLKRTGGPITRAATGHFAVINVQKAIDASAVKKSYGYFVGTTCIPCEYVETNGVAVKTVEAFKVPQRAAAAIYVVDDSALPMSLIACEAHWGVLNVRPLLADNPSPEALQNRLDRQMTRVAALTMGGGRVGQYRDSILATATDAKGIDALPTENLSNDAVNGIRLNMKMIGVEPYLRTVYRRAVQEGWAPAPTNEYQKAIWDEVHAIPQKPIKIEYNEKRDKGK